MTLKYKVGLISYNQINTRGSFTWLKICGLITDLGKI